MMKWEIFKTGVPSYTFMLLICFEINLAFVVFTPGHKCTIIKVITQPANIGPQDVSHQRPQERSYFKDYI